MALRMKTPMNPELEARRQAEIARIIAQYPAEPRGPLGLPVLNAPRGVRLDVTRDDAAGTLHLSVGGRLYPLAEEAAVVAALRAQGSAVYGS